MGDIERIVEGVYPAAALLAGMQLDLFTPLGDRPYGAGELAKLLHVQQEQLETLLYALAAAGFCCACATGVLPIARRRINAWCAGVAVLLAINI